MKESSIKRWLADILNSAFIFGLTLLLAYVLNRFHLNHESIKLIYLLGVMVMILRTNNFMMTLAASILFAYVDVKLFVDPAQYHQQSMIISTIIFLAIAIVINVIYAYLKRRIKESKANATVHKKLFKASEGLISVHGNENIINFANENLSDLADTEVEAFFDISKDDPDEAKKWCLRNSAKCGYGETEFTDSQYKYIPIRSNTKTIGVIAVLCYGKKISKTTFDCIDAFVSQISTALERDRLESNLKREAEVYAREKMKGMVLKDVSHKMYPKIVEINDLVTQLSDNESLSDDVRTQFRSIQKDTVYIVDTIDNILDITSK